MRSKLLAVLIAMTVAVPAWAGDNPLTMLAEVSGLSERKVNMLLGARTSFAEYPYTYNRALQKFHATVGKRNHERLLNGEAIALQYRGEVHVVSIERPHAKVDGNRL